MAELTGEPPGVGTVVLVVVLAEVEGTEAPEAVVVEVAGVVEVVEVVVVELEVEVGARVVVVVGTAPARVVEVEVPGRVPDLTDTTEPSCTCTVPAGTAGSSCIITEPDRYFITYMAREMSRVEW